MFGSQISSGAYRLAPSVDMRLPISVGVVDKLVTALNHVAKSPFETILFRAMFLFAFNAFARVG